MSCTVASVDGHLDSYLPPVPGDTIAIDASLNSIHEINFTSGNMIPLLAPLKRYQSPSSPVYLTSYTSVQEDSDVEKLSVVLMVGKFWNGSQDVYQGEIQIVLLSKPDALTSIGHVKLDCHLAK